MQFLKSPVLPLFIFFTQSGSPAFINDWWVIVIFLALVVIVSLLLLGNRQEPSIPAVGVHGHGTATGHENEPVQQAETLPADDLTKIEGIGPKIAALLSEHGIRTFGELAGADFETVNRILDEARLTFADPTTWPEQTRLAQSQDWEALATLQANLKGGRLAG